MAITLGNNIASLKAQSRLAKTDLAINKTYEKLSSGLRINTASDDAAGLAIADDLRAKIRIGQVAIRNANDGISTVAIADSALSEIGGVLSRFAELAEQSATGTFSAIQRSALQSEFTALGSEIERIANTTEFNGVKILSSSSALTLQVGFDSTANSRITFNNVTGTLASLGLADSGSSQLTYSLNANSLELSQSASRITLDAVNGAIQSLAQTRGALGATESRLRLAVSNLSVARENFAAAESRIRDLDVAEEAANLTRLTILQNAGAAVLAQANQAPALALKLLS
jgi:flagellin